MPKLTTPNPHDHFFKASWSRPEVAKGFLTHYLPAEVRAVLDLNTLRLSKDSFIDEALQGHYSDLLYHVERYSGQGVYVYVLMEHKSYPDRWTVFQLLRYISADYG
jgi:predicted transposase/invertase (TIGR01784 family)